MIAFIEVHPVFGGVTWLNCRHIIQVFEGEEGVGIEVCERENCIMVTDTLDDILKRLRRVEMLREITRGG